MNNIYVPIIIFLDTDNKINYERISEMISKYKNKGIKNFFIESDNYNTSNLNCLNYYNKIFKILPENSNVIIDLVLNQYFGLDEIIKKIEKHNNLAFSLNISAKFVEDYKKNKNYISKYLNKNITLYLEMAPQALKHIEVNNLVKKNNINGIILLTDYDPDLDINKIEIYKKNNRNLEIIYKSDDLFLTALRNNNSIISTYSFILMEEFNKIWNSYKNGNNIKAVIFQEKLNKKLRVLKKFNYYDVLKFYYEESEKCFLKEGDCSSIELNKEEKNKLIEIFN
ncbi:hypothetical protein C8C77_11218 [Halanaerobium saccharolyticum]|uniref:Uncharacterized protein n=1 Tax=Halanaerobium saccharolyticum TaxID=43595 RepID=A0A4R7Z667_9FIRM|nr:hypothetical protein [Halanaerobium saccharolyticum]RAK08481.1 hypothetical protein C7958_11058 [Halanaerobium saccharolyticum]TDW03484.1 hypothetical protein C8C77_11218 [Halanaerobium saccharolyticum]TDX59973.1 hypothetical protein C7956_11158 [Halanaerobium saccharolyticum]